MTDDEMAAKFKTAQRGTPTGENRTIAGLKAVVQTAHSDLLDRIHELERENRDLAMLVQRASRRRYPRIM